MAKDPNKNDDAAAPDQPYVVLARKYRPETFDDLIGQQAMVQTLTNAFATDRIAQGYMLTGVRGVGKTTTARILARALNYEKPGIDRPTVRMDGYGTNCAEIVKGSHPDVLEMDAASNTGIDNIREIIESARYRPLVARYKVYIIDEVHMLSKGAFNALLKTLEEPPEHVKFIFATTEVRKVPVTVLSRCQRFDLRRVGVGELVAHFQNIATREGAAADPEALTLIARAAEGSVRDGLSILDQAIAMGSGSVTSDAVRAMLGLADRGRIFDLLEHLFSGSTAASIDSLAALHGDGAEPVQILADLAEAVHLTSRIKVAGTDAAGEGVSGEERRRAAGLAERLSIPLLARAWQMLLKGLDEAARAPNPLAAAEMVLIRIAHTADLPTPDELMRMLGDGSAVPSGQPRAPNGGARSTSSDSTVALISTGQSRAGPAPLAALRPVASVDPGTTPRLETFADVVELAGHQRDARLRVHLEEYVSLVSFQRGKIEVALVDGAPQGLANELAEKLSNWTGERWFVTIARDARGERTIGDVRREREASDLAEVRSHPAVSALLSEFPQAEVKAVRPISPEAEAFPISGEEETGDAESDAD
ncbi:MAG: hypothetical protein RLZ98_455 [Pseudomonadota bacterium]